MTNPSIASDLIERLTRTKQIGVMELSGIPIVDDVNPDGREAAEALSQLTREVGELRAALRAASTPLQVTADDVERGKPVRCGHCGAPIINGVAKVPTALQATEERKTNGRRTVKSKG